MSILPVIEPETLEKITLFSLDDNMEIEINEIVKTEQWKEANKFYCHFYVSNFNLEDICHFSKALIRLLSVSAKEMDLLRKILIDSSKLARFCLQVKNFNEHQELVHLWGPFFIRENFRVWYFRIKDWKKYWHLEKVMASGLRSYSRFFTWTIVMIPLKDVPRGAAVRGYEEN